MAFNLIAHTGANASGGVTTSVTTSAIDTTGATLLVLGAAWNQANSATISDSKSNTWTALGNSSNASACQVQLFYVVNPTVGAGHTFTVSGATNTFPSVTVTAWTGNTSSPFDVETGSTASTATSISTGSITPSQNSELVIAIAGHDQVYATTVTNTFTISDDEQGVNSNAYGLTMAYQIQGAATATNPTFTGDGSNHNWAARIATFMAAPPSGSAASPFFRIRKDSWPGGFYH